jgi:beta-glucosidase-like glycosyl hydrolase
VTASSRVEELLGRMTHEEKLAQVVAVWMRFDADAGTFVPHPHTFGAPGAERDEPADPAAHGLGQVTRLFGSGPLAPGEGARIANAIQRRLVEGTRLGLPAIIHEECLTGFMALGATTFPGPLNWGSTWDPELIEEVGRTIGAQMRSVGVHQGLAPVLDVVRDARWGRVEECIAEDPYLVGMIGAAYIRGVQSAGVVATAKHFAGHSFSEGGRNLAPAHLGPRELADVFLVPFEMAVRLAGVRSVMNAYQDNDGVPAAADRHLLTAVLRDAWGFAGIVVADYGSVGFLHELHGTAADLAEAAASALSAGIDVELPSPHAYPQLADGPDLDRAVRRVLTVKEELGLLDDPYVEVTDAIDLDPPDARALARCVAERSIVLLRNDGDLLPLAPAASVAIIGPNGESATAVLGNYSFENHVASHYEDAPPGPPVVTVADGLRAIAEPAGGEIVAVRGCDVLGDDRAGFVEAVAAAAAAQVAVVVVGDQAGHFGSGTSGEGTDTDDLALPGVQQELVEAVAGTGTPTVVVLVTGRPYAIPWIAEHAPAVVAAWFPGEEAGAAVARVLYGEVNPSGKSPVTWSRGAGQQPMFYNDRPLGRVRYARSSTRPVFAFGHGLSYTRFEYSDLRVSPAQPGTGADDEIVVQASVTNVGSQAGDEVVQLYVRDPVASVARPIQELKGFCRVGLDAGQSAEVRFVLPVDLLSFTGVDLQRVVEPGTVEVMVGASSADIRLRGRVELTGPVRVVGRGRRLVSRAELTAPAS